MAANSAIRWSPDNTSFVVLTHAGDVHYARALLASLRYFYPSHHVIVLVDGDLVDDRLGRWENYEVIRTSDLAESLDMPLTGVLSKLAFLYRNDSQYFCYFDADSVMIGPLFSAPELQASADFYAIDGSTIDLKVDENLELFKRYALDPARVRATIDPDFSMSSVRYFSGGHFILRAGSIPPALLEDNLNELSGSYEKDKVFHFNDQSFLNWVVNRLEADGEIAAVAVDLGIYGWRTAEEEPEVTLPSILDASIASKAFIHYTGPSRHLRFKDHNFPFVLEHFHREYYRDLPRWSRQMDETRRLARYQWGRVRRLPKALTARLGSVTSR